MSDMWPIEKRFIPQAEIDKGPFHQLPLNKLWLGLWLLFITSLTCAFNGAILSLEAMVLCAISPLLARLTALDLKHLILLDIYTLPLVLIGLIYSFWSSHVTPVESFFGVMVAGFSLLALNFISEKMDKHSGIGGGDIKFCLAAGAFVGVLNLHYFFWLAFFFALLLWPVLRAYNKHISFGPALILALWSFMLFKHLL